MTQLRQQVRSDAKLERSEEQARWHGGVLFECTKNFSSQVQVAMLYHSQYADATSPYAAVKLSF